MTCFFCENQKDFILETNYWKVFISPNQTYLGRCFVALKRHCGDLAELEKEEWEEYVGLVKRLEAALRKTFEAIMFNWTCLMNDAYKKADPDPHVHWNFRPRYGQPVEVDGLFFEDQEFGRHYDNLKNKEVNEMVKETIISRIKESL